MSFSNPKAAFLQLTMPYCPTAIPQKSTSPQLMHTTTLPYDEAFAP